MKLKVLTGILHEEFETIRKTHITSGFIEVELDGEFVVLEAYISTGQVIDAGVYGTPAREELDKLSDWWYCVNFCGCDYEIGEEFDVDEHIEKSKS